MEEITLTTLDHLVLRAKQIKEIADDFDAMLMEGISVCSLAGECIGGVPSLHVQPNLLSQLSKLADQPIVIKPRDCDTFHTGGSFTYSGVYFFSLFSDEELEEYNANP